MTAAEDWLLDPSLAPSTGGRLAPLYAGAAEGRLTLPFCAACDLPLELEQQVCDGCGRDDVAWRDVAAEGTVHTVTVVHRRETGLVRAEDPYPVADVELTSGHRLLMAGRRPSAPPAIGTPVTVSFRFLGGVAVPAYDAAVPASGPPTPLPQESPR
ncbi:MAG: hypothetical protein JWO98_243 [Frankiales bacterium]|nr:hypothetical protein [Frankiales bacterium]